MDHNDWLNQMRFMYDNKLLEAPLSALMHSDEVSFDEILYRSTPTHEFETEWLRYYPPMIKHQNGFCIHST